MSLFRQIWLSVIVSALVAFVGSFAASMLAGRLYLTEQLAIKNSDNATSLALSMSQLDKDSVTIELQAAALFDSGQYRLVRVIDPDGQVMIEKTSPPPAGEVPDWFERLFPIDSKPGAAQISDGWKQFGTVELVSHSHFAYLALWQGARNLLLLFVFAALILGWLATRFLQKNIKRPLDAVVAQAEAISEKRFIRIAEPRPPELKSVVSAMNTMVDRLKVMFEREAERLETLRREATLDALTGLANRAFFLNQLDAALNNDDAQPTGSLLLLRVADLAGINRRLGREMADELLRRLGAALLEQTASHPTAAAARLNGADFALLLPGLPDPASIAEQLLAVFGELVARGLIDGD
ncbi:MAG: diguanylate cyclase, partial [Azonexus sp.]|nr:diguanylate cyclase [Azonexus sp.]